MRRANIDNLGDYVPRELGSEGVPPRASAARALKAARQDQTIRLVSYPDSVPMATLYVYAHGARSGLGGPMGMN